MQDPFSDKPDFDNGISDPEPFKISDIEEDDHTTIKDVTSAGKWFVSFLIALIALFIFNPFSYNITNKAVTAVGGKSILKCEGCPNIIGVLINVLIFFLIIRLLTF